MPGRVIRLSHEHRDELFSLLLERVEPNVFVLGVLHEDAALPSASDASTATFYGLVDRSELCAAVYTTGGGLAIPFGRSPDLLEELGEALRGRLRLRLLVGPRPEADSFWEGLEPPFEPRVWRLHRLYALRPGRLGMTGHPAIRTALPRDLDIVCEQAARMQKEELGIDPRSVDAAGFRRRIAQLIRDERLWVLPAGDFVCFQASAGAVSPHGVQIEAVYTPPLLRRRGYATRGLAGICGLLLEAHPLVTLHANEENAPAMPLYEKLGFDRCELFRLASV